MLMSPLPLNVDDSQIYTPCLDSAFVLQVRICNRQLDKLSQRQIVSEMLQI